MVYGGDQPVPRQATTEVPDATGQDADLAIARENLLAAAQDAPPRTWSRDDGGRYFDQPGQATAQERQAQNQWTEIPTIGGHTIKIDPRGNFIDVIGPNNQRLGRGRLEKDRATPIQIGNEQVFVNPDRTVDRPTQNGYERTYPGGVREAYEKTGDNQYRLTDRVFPDGSYERYANGRLRETNHRGFLTKFDEAGRKTEVSTPAGDKYAFKYGTDDKLDSYEVTKKNDKGETAVTEKGTRVDGKLKIERRQADGTMKVDEQLKDRTDVAIRSDLKLDYLDKDGYGMPDANGRSIKRDDRTVIAQMRGADGQMVPYPVNPIRSVRMADGTQIDYEYSSDKARAQGMQDTGQDTLQSYTVRKGGKVVEFAQKIPDIPGTERNNNTGWFEYQAKPGQSLPEDQIANVKRLMEPADPTKMRNQQEVADMQRKMLANRDELLKTRPMMDFMPNQKGKETVEVGIDQVTGKQFNVYGNGETRVRNEKGQEFVASVDQRTGDQFETYGDGTTYRRPWDADPRRHQFDRVTVTMPTADGVPRVELHHSRKDSSFIDVNYGADGKTPNEVIVTPAGGAPIRMAPDASNPNSWLEYKREGTQWKPTGRSFPMKVELVGKESNQTVEGQKLPAGTVVISQGDKRRIITPAGEEIVGTAGTTPTDTVPDRDRENRKMIWVTPPLPQAGRPPADGGQPQQRPDRRAGQRGDGQPQPSRPGVPPRRDLPGGVRR